MEDTTSGLLVELYTRRFLVGDPMEVKMVSNATVSVEKDNIFPLESLSCSFWQLPRRAKTRTTINALIRLLIPRKVLREDVTNTVFQI